MERSISEEERDIKEIIRRAVRAPDKKGAFRRETLNRMIALIHSPHPSIRILAAGNIQLFFNDFPDLEEAAINAVYDLCEDQSSKVRMEGYAAITQVSRASSKWIKRNADVLVQLLQSDEPDEVLIVKKALIEHMDMDPKVTLSVLCDQILPADECANNEEQVMRDRLRSLVLTFLTGEAKRSILRHAMPGSDAEAIVVEGLSEAISLLDFEEIQAIVKDLLLLLDGYNPWSHGIPLLNAIIQKTSHNLRQDLQNRTISLVTTRPLLELCNHLVDGKYVATPVDLLRFYCSSLTSRLTLQQLSPDVRCWIICNMANLFEVSRDNSATLNSDHVLAALRKQIVDACPFLLQVFYSIVQ
ncbi:hypothetical protein BDQ17DRAFT_1252511 [Cyathus striatus]|nr:hypothetical protein BDQ17DRAFT_1252511 [Cyathus striatus]